ncbi:MAG: type III pantothenate kinase [Castellaniella sp.]|nr:type III pantothenate kinase [Castellaniella sp.]
MILLIDIGNTRAKYAWLDPDASQLHITAETLDYADLSDLIGLPHKPRRILGSNVAGPDIAARLEQACRTAWGLSVHWCDTRHGRDLLRNRYTDPARLGADRWLGLLGLLRHVHPLADWRDGHPALLVSFGTATTIDTLLPEPRHDMPPAGGPHPQAAFIGGLILPGPSLMAQSLARGTAQLPLTAGHCVDFPRETHDAIASGIAAAQAGAVLRQWRLALRAAGGHAPRVFVCGGGWPVVRDTVQAALTQAQADLRLPQTPAQWLDNPVLDGLACLVSHPPDPDA